MTEKTIGGYDYKKDLMKTLENIPEEELKLSISLVAGCNLALLKNQLILLLLNKDNEKIKNLIHNAINTITDKQFKKQSKSEDMVIHIDKEQTTVYHFTGKELSNNVLFGPTFNYFND